MTAAAERAVALGREAGKDARVVELVLRESTAVSRRAPGVLIVRHRLGLVALGKDRLPDIGLAHFTDPIGQGQAG